jgi:hypothetical protein
MFLDLLLNVAKALFGLGGVLTTAKRERRVRITELLDSIDDCVRDLAEQLRDPQPGGSPWSRCTELSTYGDELAEVLDGVLPDATSDQLGKKLRRATTARGVLMEVAEARAAGAGSTDREKQLRALDEAAGTFRATANLLRTR